MKPTDTQAPPPTDDTQESVGELMGEISGDLSRLFRDEVQLAKAELREETATAGKAATLLGIAGFAGYMTVLVLTLTAVFALNIVLGLTWAALIVAGVWAVIAAITFVLGRKRFRAFSPMPRQTVETLKEDATWLRHPTN